MVGQVAGQLIQGRPFITGSSRCPPEEEPPLGTATTADNIGEGVFVLAGVHFQSPSGGGLPREGSKSVVARVDIHNRVG